ncbi:MAG TPA: hypothetical protein VJ835_02250 [Fimbriimonadaceae bacterium]|nr:hypothetical protein [Fimbriimonadaceae bacterium]
MRRIATGTMVLATALAIVGCQESQPPLTAPVVTLPPNNFDPGVDAGWKGVQMGPPTLVAELKTRNSGNHGQSFAPRRDPFALLPEERGFELSQSSERLLAESGGFRFDFEPPVESAPVEVVEPQPYRRLAGVIVGESVLALIDMGDGRLEIIRPGQRIPNSEWTVVSIDEDKAILRRSGNKLPRQIIVRLESPPFNPNQGTGGGGTTQPGTTQPGSGRPGSGTGPQGTGPGQGIPPGG